MSEMFVYYNGEWIGMGSSGEDNNSVTVPSNAVQLWSSKIKASGSWEKQDFNTIVTTLADTPKMAAYSYTNTMYGSTMFSAYNYRAKNYKNLYVEIAVDFDTGEALDINNGLKKIYLLVQDRYMSINKPLSFETENINGDVDYGYPYASVEGKSGFKRVILKVEIASFLNAWDTSSNNPSLTLYYHTKTSPKVYFYNIWAV